MTGFNQTFSYTENLSLIFNYSILTENDESIVGNTSLMHGRTYEPEVGLYYFRNRYYHPQLGRFLQQDPNGYEDSLNMYQAFNQNPVNFTDPMGLDTDAGRIASSLSKYYESIRPKNPGTTWFDRLLGNIFVTYMKFIRDVDDIDTVHFTLHTLYDTGNFLTLGTLDRTAAQKDLDIGDRVWFFLNEMPERIQNAGTFGLLDNLEAERGNGLEGAGRAVYKTLFDLSPASNIYTIFHSDASTEDKIRAGCLFPTKLASIFLLTVNPGEASSGEYLSKSTTNNGLIYDLTRVTDDSFVRFDPVKFDQSIGSRGILISFFKDRKIWLTKYKYVKDISDPKALETILYRQNLWKFMEGKFDSGATLRLIKNADDAVAAGITNMINGIPQWRLMRDVLPQYLKIIKRLF
jgi:RHS repeat-associated protein